MGAWGGPSDSRGRQLPYTFWKITTAANLLLLFVALIALVLGIATWALTFVTPHVELPDSIFAPFFAFAILGNFACVFFAMTAGGRKDWVSLGRLRHLPWWGTVPLVLLAGFMLVTGPGQLFTSLPGQPGFNAATGQYYFDDHGTVIPTDRSHYLHAVAIQTRGFMSVALFFTCVIVASTFAEARRRRAVLAPRISEVPTPPPPRPRLTPAPRVFVAVILAGLVLFVVGADRIVTRVDAYAADAPAVTVQGVKEHLAAGAWVAFVWCETDQTDAPYGCPDMSPSDLVVTQTATGMAVTIQPDMSSDHISPTGLPAKGQLTFEVTSPGDYLLRLVRPVPKGVFVAESPGSVAWSLVPEIALAVLGLLVMLFGLVLTVRRVRWRMRYAPIVVVTSIEREPSTSSQTDP